MSNVFDIGDNDTPGGSLEDPAPLYQAGMWVTEFSDPANSVTLGWSDPPPLVPTQLGGAWSSYWYNGFIYEPEISVGLNVFRFSGSAAGGAIRVPHLNPQTQEFSTG